MKGIDAWKTTAAICEAAGNEPVYAQVDGEPIGAAPISFRIVPDALSLVTPAPTRA
jgi:diacylglycerol kinase family enzyme